MAERKISGDSNYTKVNIRKDLLPLVQQEAINVNRSVTNYIETLIKAQMTLNNRPCKLVSDEEMSSMIGSTPAHIEKWGGVADIHKGKSTKTPEAVVSELLSKAKVPTEGRWMMNPDGSVRELKDKPNQPKKRKG